MVVKGHIIRDVVTGAMEPNLHESFGSKLAVKLNIYVSLCWSPVSVDVICMSESGLWVLPVRELWYQ